jgi:hypothetical protein
MSYSLNFFLFFEKIKTKLIAKEHEVIGLREDHVINKVKDIGIINKMGSTTYVVLVN